jgi:photosystem II stability/assembly factor-like uncharacterized protein
MKKLAATALILLLLGGLAACQAQSTPTPLPTTPTNTNTPVAPEPTARPSNTPIPPLNSPNGPPLRSLEMFTALDGWGLIDNTLLLTHSGGLNWFSVPLPEGQVDIFTRIFFIDMNTFYLVVPAADGQTGQLYYTNNGGGSWRVNPVPFLDGQMIFIDQVGYFLETIQTGSKTMSATLFNSNDNGLTWNNIFPGANQDPGSSLPETGIKTGFSFISIDRGWLTVASQPQKVLLYNTENGGRNWAPQEIPIPENITSLVTTSLPPVFFTGNNDEGLLPVDFVSMDTGARNRVFYFTSDSGVTWSPGASIVDGETYTFLDPKTGWVWGKRGLYFTSDSAQTWQLLPVAFGRSEHATSLKFIDKNTGWLLTADTKNRIRIYNTRDGGNTWMAINP